MTSPNRVGGEGSTRSLLMNTTERIMLEEGYAAVTYRNVAAKAGVSLGAVQYHFPSLDDLFMAVVRQYSERTLETVVSELRANPGDVLRVLWERSGDEISTALLLEIMALANHRKSIHAEIEGFAQLHRKVQIDAVTENWENLGFPTGELTPAAIVFLLTCLPRWMRLEDSFGMAEGGADVFNLVERYLDRADPTLNSRDHRQLAPWRRGRLGFLNNSSVSDAVHKPKLSPDSRASYRPSLLAAALRLFWERAALSAKAVAHYSRMGWRAWARRDNRGTTHFQ
ncbi:TetR/AcrR family transcriptional regulator [Mycobacterium sp.]|uniref:TetR/AcrR family transcriptional regulator n=1 Tax=Mycobacterium sp. TaxID=1785 RepID=UPI003C772820